MRRWFLFSSTRPVVPGYRSGTRTLGSGHHSVWSSVQIGDCGLVPLSGGPGRVNAVFGSRGRHCSMTSRATLPSCSVNRKWRSTFPPGKFPSRWWATSYRSSPSLIAAVISIV